MALSLKDPEADWLTRQAADLTGESLTEAVRAALRDRLAQERLKRGEVPPLAQDLKASAARCAALAELDGRSGEEIPGYNDKGLPVQWFIDSSALVAILLGEPEGPDFIEAITADHTKDHQRREPP